MDNQYLRASPIVIIVSIVIVFIIILLSLIIHSRSIENDLLLGFWKSDSEFNEIAELDLFMVKFGEDSCGYILVMNQDGIIINNPVKFYRSGISLNPFVNTCREYTLCIDWLDEKGYDFFPSEQTLKYYPTEGKLVFSHKDEILAIVYKDPSILC